VAQTIDWELNEKAMNKTPLAKRQWVSKLSARFLPDGKNMQCWGQWPIAKCPQCTCPMEDKEHIFKCPAELASVNESFRGSGPLVGDSKNTPTAAA